MAGPISLPDGPKSRWEELNEIVCDIHFHCNMEKLDANDRPVRHDFITYRIWLARRNKLRTGKTL